MSLGKSIISRSSRQTTRKANGNLEGQRNLGKKKKILRSLEELIAELDGLHTVSQYLRWLTLLSDAEFSTWCNWPNAQYVVQSALEIEQARRARLQAEKEARGEQPSIVNSIPSWIWAEREQGTYPDDTERNGKWMVFPKTEEVDLIWWKIDGAVRASHLGSAAKVWPMGTPGEEHVICIYTYDSDDKTDLLRILSAIRGLGINHRAMYKEDRETFAGNYEGVAFIWKDDKRIETKRSPVKWYARDGRVELLRPKTYTLFDPAWLQEQP